MDFIHFVLVGAFVLAATLDQKIQDFASCLHQYNAETQSYDMFPYSFHKLPHEDESCQNFGLGSNSFEFPT
jgi:hypothetical protein